MLLRKETWSVALTAAARLLPRNGCRCTFDRALARRRSCVLAKSRLVLAPLNPQPPSPRSSSACRPGPCSARARTRATRQGRPVAKIQRRAGPPSSSAFPPPPCFVRPSLLAARAAHEVAVVVEAQAPMAQAAARAPRVEPARRPRSRQLAIAPAPAAAERVAPRCLDARCSNAAYLAPRRLGS